MHNEASAHLVSSNRKSGGKSRLPDPGLIRVEAVISQRYRRTVAVLLVRTRSSCATQIRGPNLSR